MCTVTLIPLPCDAGIRLACNRDEQRTRAPALPPTVRRCGDRFAIMPIDPQGGGTWIAANDAGLVMTILNVNPLSPPPARPRSRGEIIPMLMRCGRLGAAVDAAEILPSDAFGPFRLVMTDGRAVIEFVSDGATKSTVEHVACRPTMFTSSGLGDHLVDRPRRDLFDAALAGPSADAQDAFHRHSWPDATHLSVCMRRADATTVSHTVVELRGDAVIMRYTPAPPDVAAESRELRLPLRVPDA